MKEMLMSVGGGVVPPSNIYGDIFLGEVPASKFITGDALASAIGLTAGTAQNSTANWLKFNLEGKTLYVAKRTYRHSVSWNQINARGAVFGTATVMIQGDTYKVRLLKGANTDPISGGSGQHDPEQSWGSEWNRLFYPLVPNPVNTPTHPVSREGIRYGVWANYTEVELNIGSSGGNGRYTWCQESSGSSRVLRGLTGLSFFNFSTSSITGSSYGWRPCLELVS